MLINLMVTVMLANPIAADCKECNAYANQSANQSGTTANNRRITTRDKTRFFKKGRCR
jgi:hypothetical protein